ncbi:glutathione S-transferase family protein [Aliiglaciecola sp. CAU 1673]|uniref:glutathione S-transferase family protein n=1 Tax=Aliiglaciecola sp. CAU 1673 TaxID=3032595 RepID=UPI0023DAC49E|nr:glutathione S-transferase family protein [Aliiglaciecola sp. CAU 1673]MDF2180244.1 glutathione S-transferase family protein [Aliiglaciecola sp. CAU 1673]
MYTLYFSPGACSLATQVILREINQPFELVNKSKVADFSSINPIGAVPVLATKDKIFTEGAAIILHLLDQHPNDLLPGEGLMRTQSIEHLLFANATMHPAYSKLFFINNALEDSPAKQQAFDKAAAQVGKLWQVVEDKLDGLYLNGKHLSPAEILLAVYASWGQYFPVDIAVGPQAQAMIDHVSARASYQASLAAEQQAG